MASSPPQSARSGWSSSGLRHHRQHRLALVSAVLIGGPSTGGAVNPVRALGPQLVSGTFTSFWVYLLAPVVGNIVAAVVYDRVIARASAGLNCGRGPSPFPALVQITCHAEALMT